jgi:hypothetical protein
MLYWAATMERYIGSIKPKVSLFSNIDMEMANKATIQECLNHFPPTAPLNLPSPKPGYDAIYPHLPSDSRMLVTKPATPALISVLRMYYRAYQNQYPIVSSKIILWKKFWAYHDCYVGSQQSQRQSTRDDSYIWWERDGRRQYGQVVIFAIVWDWEAIAIVQPLKRYVEFNGQVIALPGELGRMTPLKVTEIGGLVGRIRRIKGRRNVDFLVGGWE